MFSNTSSQCFAARLPLDGGAVDGFNPENIQVSASADDGNVAANTIDGDLGTRWSALGNGQTITYDLGGSYPVSGLNIAFYRGDERQTDIDIETSSDNSNWDQVWSGRQPALTTQLQPINFAASNARYVRIVGYGNTSNNWNSLSEVEVCVSGENTAFINAYLAYGGSAYGDAVATDKTPLRNDETSGLANYSNYHLGINRVIVDITNLPNDGQSVSADDFIFKTGNDNDPNGWSTAPLPSGVSVAADDGEAGSDRVTITWADSAILNTWLQVTVKQNSNTGLSADEVFYFGHAAYEANSPVEEILRVDFSDAIEAYMNQTAFLDADMSDIYDYNRDQSVNFLDAISAYLNQHSTVKIITPTVATSAGSIQPADLIDWYLNTPADRGNGLSERINEVDLANGWTDPDYFWYAADGGLVFRCTVAGFKTSENTSYVRTELREMLRAGNTSISTQGVNDNNWVFSSTPQSDQNNAGGVDGTLTATLAVNHVSTTGSSSQRGRVIVGQIHAPNDEPCRLYYRKLPGHTKGSIYIAHEPNGASDDWYDMIGSRSSSASDPVDGVALDEVWSYEINVTGNLLTVTIIREGKPDVVQMVDMTGSGYDQSGKYMYFKAGAYIQDNTGDDNDYAQVTFYALDNQHP